MEKKTYPFFHHLDNYGSLEPGVLRQEGDLLSETHRLSLRERNPSQPKVGQQDDIL